MDIIDDANESNQFHRDLAINQVLRSRAAERPLVVGGIRYCIDCEEPIHDDRLRVKPDAVRCVDCQNAHDRREALKWK